MASELDPVFNETRVGLLSGDETLPERIRRLLERTGLPSPRLVVVDSIEKLRTATPSIDFLIVDGPTSDGLKATTELQDSKAAYTGQDERASTRKRSLAPGFGILNVSRVEANVDVHVPILLLTAPGTNEPTRTAAVADSLPRPNGGAHDRSLARALTALGYRQLFARCREALESESSERRRIERMFGFASPFDPRTGWHSHGHIIDRCQQEIVRSLRAGDPIALVAIDVVNLPEIRAQHGAEMETNLLTHVARRLRSISRHGDHAGHYGPSTVLMLLPNTDREGGDRFCQRASQALLPPFVIDDVAILLEWRLALVAREQGASHSPTDLLNELERTIEEAPTYRLDSELFPNGTAR